MCLRRLMTCHKTNELETLQQWSSLTPKDPVLWDYVNSSAVLFTKELLHQESHLLTQKMLKVQTRLLTYCRVSQPIQLEEIY